jgi:hypothetical protein
VFFPAEAAVFQNREKPSKMVEYDAGWCRLGYTDKKNHWRPISGVPRRPTSAGVVHRRETRRTTAAAVTVGVMCSTLPKRPKVMY